MASTDRVNARVRAAFARRDMAEAERLLSEFDPGELSESERHTWYQTRAIVAFRKGDRGEALVRYQEAVARFPRSGELRFGLGQELEFQGQFDRALAEWAPVRFPATPPRWNLVIARYCYLWGRPTDGFVFLNAVLEAIVDGRLVDDHLLITSGFPSFGELWRYVVALSWQVGPEQLRHDAETLRQNASELRNGPREPHDVSDLQAEMEALLTGEVAQLVARHEATVASAQPGFPVGIHRIAATVLRSRTQAYAEAREALAAVPLGPGDFPWLGDVRMLALAENAARHGCEGEEQERLAAFRARQPLLFEPDHAVRFGFLPYQERLRIAYMAGRGAVAGGT
jgi:tetratricopeptide (TPR) repeat protein